MYFMLIKSQLQSTHADVCISQQFRMRFELGAKAVKFLPGRMTQCFFHGHFPDQADFVSELSVQLALRHSPMERPNSVKY